MNISFTKHPHEMGRTYLGHMYFAISLSVKLILIGIAAFIHAIFPFFFVTTASSSIKDMYNKLQSS